jgi:hypothetical protein
MRFRTSVSAFLLASSSAAAVAGLFGPSNFEECMVEKMKGQSESMLGIVHQLCREKFPVKEPKRTKVHPRANDLEYTWHQSSLKTSPFEPAKPYVAIKITRNSTGYLLTNFVGKFSEKDCSASTDADFKYSISFDFLISESASAYNDTGRTFKCVRLTEFYGHK